MKPQGDREAERTVKEVEYCAFCGTDLDRAAGVPRRFGEPFCSDAHADAFVQEARAARIESASSAGQPADAAPSRGQATSGWGLKRTLKMAACCGLPFLAIVLLAGGGGAMLGAGVAVLPYVATLACPLGMFFMMRGMQAHGNGEGRSEGDRPPQSKELKQR